MHNTFLFRYKLHYLLALSAFVVWMLFFDEKDVFTQHKRTKELETIQGKIDYFKTEIKSTRTQIDQLDKDPYMLEKFAREKYYMKRDDEDVYVIEPLTIGEK